MSHRHPIPVILPFTPNLHDEFLVKFQGPLTTSYVNVKELAEHGYAEMSWVEDALVSYLVPSAVSSWKAPALPLRPCHMTSRLDSRALHTLLQAYQVDLLKDLDLGAGVPQEFFRASDLVLWPTKQVARAVGRSIAALVATEIGCILPHIFSLLPLAYCTSPVVSRFLE